MGGIALSPRPSDDNPYWREFSLERWLDWGMVDFTWNNSLQNERCEAASIAVAQEIDAVLQDERVKQIEIPQFTMVYELSPYLPTNPI